MSPDPGDALRPCLTLVMPVFNEESTIRLALERVLSQPFVSEVIVIDDASTDKTSECFRRRIRKAVGAHWSTRPHIPMLRQQPPDIFSP